MNTKYVIFLKYGIINRMRVLIYFFNTFNILSNTKIEFVDMDYYNAKNPNEFIPYIKFKNLDYINREPFDSEKEILYNMEQKEISYKKINNNKYIYSAVSFNQMLKDINKSLYLSAYILKDYLELDKKIINMSKKYFNNDIIFIRFTTYNKLRNNIDTHKTLDINKINKNKEYLIINENFTDKYEFINKYKIKSKLFLSYKFNPTLILENVSTDLYIFRLQNKNILRGYIKNSLITILTLSNAKSIIKNTEISNNSEFLEKGAFIFKMLSK